MVDAGASWSAFPRWSMGTMGLLRLDGPLALGSYNRSHAGGAGSMGSAVGLYASKIYSVFTFAWKDGFVYNNH